MGRKIESFDDWYGGISVGQIRAYEKYTKYVFRKALYQHLDRLKKINDRHVIESLFDSMMKETEIPVPEIERVMAMIHHCYEEQIQLEKNNHEGE